MMNDTVSIRVEGHVCARDGVTKELLFEKRNAINPENLSEAIALSIANRANGYIYEMVFGNGASTVSRTGAITYFPPNITGSDAQLYNETYSKVVNDTSPANTDKERNFLSVQHIRGNFFSDVMVTCFLDYGEPNGQEAFDTSTDGDGMFVFDEIGLRSFDPIVGQGKLLTHCIFHPFQKSLNRTIEITYTLRFLMN